MRESYLSDRVNNLKPSGIRKFFDIAATMQGVISLGIGEPDFTTPEAIIEAGVRSLRQGHTHYTSNAGIIELREKLSAHLNQMYGIHYQPDGEIIITVGGSEALYLTATALLNPGDEVIIPTPCFVSYQAEVILAGAVPVEIPCHMENNFEVDPAEIEAAITSRTKAILIGFPNNPTGAVASRETLEEIARIADKYDLIVISDEIYDRLVYGQAHVCYPTIAGTHERTMLLGGFSKDYAMTGWRIGYACGPKTKMQSQSTSNATSIAQKASVEAMNGSQDAVAAMCVEFEKRRTYIVDRLNAMPGVSCFKSNGAFYVFPNFSGCYGKTTPAGKKIENSTDFAAYLLEDAKVALVPGIAFGDDRYARLSYAISMENITKGMDRIEEAIKNLK